MSLSMRVFYDDINGLTSQKKLLRARLTDLVVVLHELDDDPDVVPVVLDGDDPHDICSILNDETIAVHTV